MKRFVTALFLILALVGSLLPTPALAQLTGPVVSGVVVLDGSNPSSATTGLATLTSCVITGNTATAPGVKYALFTVQFTPTSGRIDIYAWKQTSSSDTTLIASTWVGDQVAYICTGHTN